MSLELRTRRFLAHYGRPVALVCAVVAIAAFAGAAYVYANPPTERVTEEVNVEAVDSSLSTSATVTGNTTLYRQGQRLVDQSAYVMDATPELQYRVRTNVPPDRAVAVQHRLVLRIAASRNGNVFWETRRTVIDERQVVENGEAVSTATANMSEFSDFFDERRRQIGDIGTYTAEVALNTTYDTGRYRGGITDSQRLVFRQNAYWIDGAVAGSRTHGENTSRVVTGPPNWATIISLVLVGLLALMWTGGIAYLRRQEVDLHELDVQISESQYEEWISEGQIPTDPDRKYVNIGSLEDLVDVAIDSRKRVIHDAEFDVYSVADGDIVYYFTVGDFGTERWLNM